MKAYEAKYERQGLRPRPREASYLNEICSQVHILLKSQD